MEGTAPCLWNGTQTFHSILEVYLILIMLAAEDFHDSVPRCIIYWAIPTIYRTLDRTPTSVHGKRSLKPKMPKLNAFYGGYDLL